MNNVEGFSASVLLFQSHHITPFIHKGTVLLETDCISQVKQKHQRRRDHFLHTADRSVIQVQCGTAHSEHEVDASVIDEFITNNELLSSSPPQNNQDDNLRYSMTVKKGGIMLRIHRRLLDKLVPILHLC